MPNEMSLREAIRAADDTFGEGLCHYALPANALEPLLDAAEAMAKLEEMAAIDEYTHRDGTVARTTFHLERLGDGKWDCTLYGDTPIYYDEGQHNTALAAINAAYEQFEKERADV